MPLKRTDLDSEDRCIGISNSGAQCENIAEEGNERCLACGGPSPDARNDVQDYLTEQFKRRIHIDSEDVDAVKLLRDNLMDINAVAAVLRNKMTDEGSTLANYSKMTDLMMQAEKITNTLHRLSVNSGLLLARPALVRWTLAIRDAVGEVIEDKYEGWEDDLILLSDRVAAIVVETKNQEGEKP